MALNIKNQEVEELAEEVARLTKETKTEAIKNALRERKSRLILSSNIPDRAHRLKDFLVDRIWTQIPLQSSNEVSKEEREKILGYGEEGL